MNNDFIDKIHLGKWEDVMPQLPSASVDIIITSPPYNVNLGNNKHKKDKYESYDDDMPYTEYIEWITKLFWECNRVLKTGGRLCVNIGDGANGRVPTHVDFTHRLLNLSGFEFSDGCQPFQMITTIVWNKNQIGASTAWGSWCSPSCPSFPTQFEFIIVVGKGTTTHDGNPNSISVSAEDFIRNSRALWEFLPETEMMKKWNHPACFPEELPRRLIDQLTYIGDVVLDPFSGAGTTCSVAKSMRRKYIGIEMSEKYYRTSLSRLSGVPTMNAVVDAEGNETQVPQWML